MEHQKLLNLIDKVDAGTATQAEIEALDTYYVAFEQKPGYIVQLTAEEREIYKEMVFARLSEKVGDMIVSHRNTLIPSTKKFKLWLPLLNVSVAAAIALIVIGIYFFKPTRQDLPPGRNSATLTLGNGKKIILSDVPRGELAHQMGVSITKTKEGQVVYHIAGENDGNQPVTYNTLSTARGETYTIQLPDGTKVMLNAASSLTFPTTFASLTERSVELSGEGYFSVTHNVKQPFKVKTENQLVEDLGTEFNINAYEDETRTKTTLVEGSVKIMLPSLTESVVLNPGQQAIIETGKTILVNNVATTEAVAWKDGFFQFDNAGVEEVMRQLKRWYDVDIIYEGKIPDRAFTGKIYRNLNASEALKGLKFTGLNFKIDNKKIIVTN